ncbi:MAG: cytidine deaminase [Peptococcaceae bacterium]|jgi:cytidine deaminase|nr:cytidine deaminase [Peptococcaceae bacterium]
MTNDKRTTDIAPEHEYLIRQAFDTRKRAYAPYSGFMVGAALLTTEGKVYTGCNIENAAYSPSNCAERTAFFKAVCEGERHFKAIAVVGGPKEAVDGKFDYAYPCGVCRQVMAEFCDEDFAVIVAISHEEYRLHTLKELLPEAFSPRDLVQPDDGKAAQHLQRLL